MCVLSLTYFHGAVRLLRSPPGSDVPAYIGPLAVTDILSGPLRLPSLPHCEGDFSFGIGRRFSKENKLIKWRTINDNTSYIIKSISELF